MQQAVEDWLALAVVIGDPRCGLVVVMKQEETKGKGYGANRKANFRIVGDCTQQHDHAEAASEAKQRLLTKNGR